MKATSAYYRFGFSATPFKSDIGTELNLVGATGEIIKEFSVGAAIEAGVLVPPRVYMINLGIPPLDGEMDYQEEYKQGIVDCPERNDAIVEIARRYTARGIPTIILIRIIRHGESLADRLDVPFLSGRDVGEVRDKARKQMIGGKVPCLVASTIFDEAVDLPNVGCIITAGAGRAHHVTLQRTGRGLRPSEGKEHLDLFDFYDGHGVRLERQSRARRRTYKETEGVIFAQITEADLHDVLARE
jgi:superfamily II DNA or RNA helicase